MEKRNAKREEGEQERMRSSWATEDSYTNIHCPKNE
jgi:hypothetical protein